MKLQFIVGMAVGALAGMIFIESCPKARRVVKEGRQDIERQVDKMKRCGKKFGRKICFC